MSPESQEYETRRNKTKKGNLWGSRLKPFNFTPKIIFNKTEVQKYYQDKQIDNDRPPGGQEQYYRQQVVAGQSVYQYGVPPQPAQAGRMQPFRSGQETALAREGRGDRPQGGFSSFFGSGHNEEDDESIERISHFNTVEIRNRFIRKVYSLLTLQLLMTFGFIFLAIHVEPIRIFLRRNTTITIVVACSSIVVVIAITCSQTLRKRSPYNVMALCIMTLLYAYVLAAMSCIYDTVAVYMATGTTAIVCFLVSILACQMKWDITKCGCMLYILLMGLIIYGIISTILVFFVSPETFKVMHLVYSGIGLAVFILYLIFDTQMIMGGRYIELSPEEYVLGTLKLYIDVIMIYNNLLSLYG